MRNIATFIISFAYSFLLTTTLYKFYPKAKFNFFDENQFSITAAVPAHLKVPAESKKINIRDFLNEETVSDELSDSIKIIQYSSVQRSDLNQIVNNSISFKIKEQNKKADFPLVVVFLILFLGLGLGFLCRKYPLGICLGLVLSVALMGAGIFLSSKWAFSKIFLIYFGTVSVSLIIPSITRALRLLLLAVFCALLITNFSPIYADEAKEVEELNLIIKARAQLDKLNTEIHDADKRLKGKKDEIKLISDNLIRKQKALQSLEEDFMDFLKKNKDFLDYVDWLHGAKEKRKVFLLESLVEDVDNHVNSERTLQDAQRYKVLDEKLKKAQKFLSVVEDHKSQVRLWLSRFYGQINSERERLNDLYKLVLIEEQQKEKKTYERIETKKSAIEKAQITEEKLNDEVERMNQSSAWDKVGNQWIYSTQVGLEVPFMNGGKVVYMKELPKLGWVVMLKDVKLDKKIYVYQGIKPKNLQKNDVVRPGQVLGWAEKSQVILEERTNQ